MIPTLIVRSTMRALVAGPRAEDRYGSMASTVPPPSARDSRM